LLHWSEWMALVSGAAPSNKIVFWRISFVCKGATRLRCSRPAVEAWGNTKMAWRGVLQFVSRPALVARGREAAVRRPWLRSGGPCLCSYFGHLEVWMCWPLMLPLAGRGGEGRWRRGEFFSASSRWCDCFVLHRRANHAVALIASAIFGRKGGHLRRQGGVSFNLQRGGPVQSFSSDFPSSLCQVVCPRRSQGGQRSKLNFGGEDQGPDCFSCFLSKALYANFQDYVVTSSSVQGPVCNMFPPLLI
jgi:hypothetical protein